MSRRDAERWDERYARDADHQVLGEGSPSPFLRRQIGDLGSGRALEMSLTNRWVDAEEAHAIGLVDVLVDDDGLADRVAEIAAAAARTDPDVGIAMTELYRHAGDGSLDDALAAEEAAWRAQADPR